MSLDPKREGQYLTRLENVYENERDRLASLQTATDAQRNQMAARQTQTGQAQLYGTASGGGASALRGATYASGDLAQSIANDAAAQKAADDQAFLRYQQELQARRGQYAMMGMQGATALEEREQEKLAQDSEDSYGEMLRRDQEEFGRAGIGLGVVGAGLGAASDKRTKKEIREVGDDAYADGLREGVRLGQQSATGAVSARRSSRRASAADEVAEPQARPVVDQALDWYRQSVINPMLPESGEYNTRAAGRELGHVPAQGGGTAASGAAAPKPARGYVRQRANIPRAAEPVTMIRPGAEPAGTYGYEPRTREFTPDDPNAVVFEPEVVVSDARLKSLVTALEAENADMRSKLAAQGPVRTEGRQRDTRAADIGRELDAEGARTMTQLGAGGPVQTGGRKSAADEEAARIGAELDREDDQMLRSFRGRTWEYTDEAQDKYNMPPGRRYGVIADEIEQTPLGATLVRRLPDGTKVLDSQAMTTALPAAIGRVAERQDETEQRLSSLASALDEEDARTRAEMQRGGRVRP